MRLNPKCQNPKPRHVLEAGDEALPAALCSRRRPLGGRGPHRRKQRRRHSPVAWDLTGGMGLGVPGFRD